MTNGDICKMYREAKDKKKQIAILQDLAGKTKEEVIEILVEGGEDINYMKEQKKDPAAQRTRVIDKEKPQQPTIPEAVAIALYNQLEIIEREIYAKEQQYKEIVAFIQGGQQA